MLPSDNDMLENHVQLRLLEYNQKFHSLLRSSGKSAQYPNGLFGMDYHLTSVDYASKYGAEHPHGPSISPIQPFDNKKSSQRFQNQLDVTAINLEIAATTTVVAWQLLAVGPTIRAALFDPLLGHAEVRIVDITDYLKNNYSNLSSQDIFTLDGTLNMYNGDSSLPANFVAWDSVYATYTSHSIAIADASRLAHFATAVRSHLVFSDRLRSFYIMNPSPASHTYAELKRFMLASDRNMAAIQPAVIGLTSLPSASAAVATATEVALAAIEKQVKALTASVSKLSTASPAASVCNKCKQLSPTVHTLWQKCKVHNKHAK